MPLPNSICKWNFLLYFQTYYAFIFTESFLFCLFVASPLLKKITISKKHRGMDIVDNHLAHDLGLSGQIEVVTFYTEEKRVVLLSWVVKTESGSTKQRVTSSPAFQGLCNWIYHNPLSVSAFPPFYILINPWYPLNRRMWISLNKQNWSTDSRGASPEKVTPLWQKG